MPFYKLLVYIFYFILFYLLTLNLFNVIIFRNIVLLLKYVMHITNSYYVINIRLI
jgi:hypothetical protein